MKRKVFFGLVFLIFINGYISLSLELVVLRQLSFYVGSSAVITSIIMGLFLGFMSLGYFTGSSKKIKDNKIKSLLNRSFLSLALITFLASSFPLITAYFILMYGAGVQMGALQTFLYSLIFLSLGPFLFGFNTTLISRKLHKYNTNYTGSIMAWDTIGSVLGSLLTTLVLMPFLGVNYTVIFIVLLSILAAFIVKPSVKVLLVGLIILLPTAYVNSNYFQKKNFGILVNNANSTILISQKFNDKVLYMNGLPMSIYNPVTRGSASYINYINDNFIYNMPKDKVRKILVLGAGGFTAGLNDTFNDYIFVDIEKTLKDVSEKYFLNEKLTPNKKFVVQDASQFLKNSPEKYDMIILDVYSNSYQIPEGLITAEFMQRLKARVADNGIVIMNMITSPSFDDEYTKVFDNTFHSVFRNNTQRQVIDYMNPWLPGSYQNILYIFYNKENSGRIYTINKTPVIYDRY